MYKSSFVLLIAVLLILGSGALAQPTAENDSSDYSGSWAQVPDILSRIRVPKFPEQDYNVLDYGAVPGGTEDCRGAILEAIKDCNANGGGRVIVPEGTFLSNGPIHLKSYVNLHLAEGSTILFGTRTADYLPPVLMLYEGTRIYNYSPFIFAYKQKNLAITGTGTVNGQATEVWATWAQDPVKIEKDKQVRRQNNAGVPVAERVYGEGDKIRPGFIQFLECNNILLEDFLIIDSPFWCIHPVYCQNVTIRSVRLNTLNLTSSIT